jgi:hypothetical protein
VTTVTGVAVEAVQAAEAARHRMKDKILTIIRMVVQAQPQIY